MRTIVASVLVNKIGRYKEEGVTQVFFPKFDDYPAALSVTRAGDIQPYPVSLTDDGDHFTWTVQLMDTLRVGEGSVEVQYFGPDGEVAKSVAYPILVEPSKDFLPVEAPDPFQDWLTQGMQAEVFAEAAAAEAKGYRDEAERHKDDAEIAQYAAETAQHAAEAARHDADNIYAETRTYGQNAIEEMEELVQKAWKAEDNAEDSADDARDWSNRARQYAETSSASANESSGYRDAAQAAMLDTKTYRNEAMDAKNRAINAEDTAKNYAAAALVSQNAASSSEVNARASEINAYASERKAQASETNAKTSEASAKQYSDKAKDSELQAWLAAEAAQKSTDDSLANKNAAAGSASAAEASKNAAKISETNAATSAASAKESEDEVLGAVIELGRDFVLQQSSKPTERFNKLWIDEAATEVEIPDMGDFNTLKEDLAQLEDTTSQLSESITEISDKISEVIVSDNMHDETTDIVGKYLENNVLKSMEKWTTTDFIFIGGMNRIYLSATMLSTGDRYRPYFMFLNKYDADKGYIGCVALPNSDKYDVEENVKYIRFGFINEECKEVCVKQVESPDYDEFVKYTRFKTSDYVISGDIEKQKEIADNIEVVLGKNIFNEDASIHGYLSNKGTIKTDVSGWMTTDFMDVSEFSKVYVTKKVTEKNRQDAYIAFWTAYNENKELISQFLNQATVGEYPVSIPTGTHYLRVCYRENENPQLQIEGGSVATSYEPYEYGMKFIKSPYNNEKKGSTDWTGKKWVCVGDSLTENNFRTTMHYHDYISNETGIFVVNMGVSGTGYKRTENENKAFYQRVLNVPTDADVVTIFGSFNDYGLVADSLGNPSDTGTATICGCINTTIDRLIQRIPRVQLGIVSPTPWGAISDTNGFGQYVNALATICKNRGIPYLDLYHCSGLRPWTEEGRENFYSKDDGNGVHPDEYGHKLIAPRFKAFLETLIL